jgi:hypothetical protein
MKKDKRRDKNKTKKRERSRTAQRQLLKKRRRSLHNKHKDRRKKDCMIGMPFIVAFHGDPAQLFYCDDYPKTYELIPRTEKFPMYERYFARLMRYLSHWVTQIHNKVLIWKAG